MQPSVDLSGLKDVILPAEPSIFPLAPGWWIILGLLYVCAVAVILISLIRYFSPQNYTLRELKRLYEQTPTSLAFAKEVSKLLKRVALLKYGPHNIAKLGSAHWARFLGEKGKDILSPEETNFIAFSSYMPQNKSVQIDKDNLYHAARQLIIKMFRGK